MLKQRILVTSLFLLYFSGHQVRSLPTTCTIECFGALHSERNAQVNDMSAAIPVAASRLERRGPGNRRVSRQSKSTNAKVSHDGIKKTRAAAAESKARRDSLQRGAAHNAIMSGRANQVVAEQRDYITTTINSVLGAVRNMVLGSKTDVQDPGKEDTAHQVHPQARVAQEPHNIEISQKPALRDRASPESVIKDWLSKTPNRFKDRHAFLVTPTPMGISERDAHHFNLHADVSRDSTGLAASQLKLLPKNAKFVKSTDTEEATLPISESFRRLRKEKKRPDQKHNPSSQEAFQEAADQQRSLLEGLNVNSGHRPMPDRFIQEARTRLSDLHRYIRQHYKWSIYSGKDRSNMHWLFRKLTGRHSPSFLEWFSHLREHGYFFQNRDPSDFSAQVTHMGQDHMGRTINQGQTQLAIGWSKETGVAIINAQELINVREAESLRSAMVPGAPTIELADLIAMRLMVSLRELSRSALTDIETLILVGIRDSKSLGSIQGFERVHDEFDTESQRLANGRWTEYEFKNDHLKHEGVELKAVERLADSDPLRDVLSAVLQYHSFFGYKTIDRLQTLSHKNENGAGNEAHLALRFGSPAHA